MDQLPDKKDKCEEFKRFLANLSGRKVFRDVGIRFDRRFMQEIDSAKHVQAQALDVVLGAMHFRLNDFHKAKPEGARLRGSRTRAKEEVYKHIRHRITQTHPNFNIGISTGKPNGFVDLWNMRYRHWEFKSAAYRINPDAKK